MLLVSKSYKMHGVLVEWLSKPHGMTKIILKSFQIKFNVFPAKKIQLNQMCFPSRQ